MPTTTPLKGRQLAPALALLGGLPAGVLAAEPSFPTRPIRMVVPFAPGGPTDTVGRIVAARLSERLGVSVVVDNRPGATGMLGSDMVAKAAPDGYTTLLCSNSAMVTGPLLLAKPPYDARRDFSPLTQVVSVPYLLFVNPASGIGSVKELIALARAKPGTLNYGSAGTASMSHLAGVLFGRIAGVDLVHVPYKGSSVAATDLIGGQLQLIFEAAAAGMQHVKSGRLRALGVSTVSRIALLPDLPTIAESGVPGYELSVWHGICGPAAMPAPLVARLNRELVAAINGADTRARLVAIGSEVVAGPAEAFRKVIVDEFARWEKLAREGLIKAQ